MKQHRWQKWVISTLLVLVVWPVPAGMGANPQEAAEAYSVKAYRLLEAGKLDEALAAYQDALKFNPSDAGLHNNIGYIYLTREQYKEARLYFQTAIKLNMDSADSWANLATALYGEGKLQLALKAYERATLLNPHEEAFKKALEFVKIKYNEQHTSPVTPQTVTSPSPEPKPSANNPEATPSPVATPEAVPTATPKPNQPEKSGATENTEKITLATDQKQNIWNSSYLPGAIPGTASLLLPGTGQLYNGITKSTNWFDIGRGGAYLALTGLAYWQLLESTKHSSDPTVPTLWAGGLAALSILSSIDAGFTAK